jgi:benzoyl-CoA reductase/2-hydroxyglutaryl-CoA dehydratase subunit BcrC/BadD/HgdB
LSRETYISKPSPIGFPDLVIDIVLQSCHTCNVEAVKVESSVREDFDTNYLKVVTDFSQQDLGQLKTRIAAAFEMN